MERASDTLSPVPYNNRSTAGTLNIVLFIWRSNILIMSPLRNIRSICSWVNMYGVKLHWELLALGNLGMKQSCPWRDMYRAS